ncbi:phage tail spike protein [Virgibacillus salarius]
MIHITDGQLDKILDYITYDNLLSDKHRQSLQDYLETFEFRAIADGSYTEFLGKHNRVIIPAEDNGYKEFVIQESGKYRDTQGIKVEVYASASYLLLKKAKIIYPQTLHDQTPTTAVSQATNDTEWVPGIIEGEGNRTFYIEQHTNPFSFLKTIAKEFELELHFRVETDGNHITGRYVDLLEKVGQWRGREVEFGKDLVGIRRVEKTDNIYTALVGLGPEKEDGTRLEVFVENKEALQRWGRPNPQTGELKHLIDVYEPQSTREDMTINKLQQYTKTELNKRINAVVEYETTVADLENVPGMENKKIRFGDTIKIKDTKFSPPIYLEARVHTQERSIVDGSQKQIELGDYIEYTEEEVKAIWRSLQEEIRKKIGYETMMKYAEPKKVVSDTPPEQNENVIWVDTSQEPYVPKVYNYNEWQKMTPTEAYEVGAYNKGEVDDISKDASRLTEGIIDVDSVPLRTSVTGARIAWDGVNGLIQYDMDGNVVGRMSLDGTSYFKNGYFEGEVQAQTGHFSGDVSGATGTFGEVTVKNGNFTLEDDISDMKYSATPKRNLVKDHSFELVIADPDSLNSNSIKYNWLDMKESDVPFENHWRKSGMPKVATVFGPDNRSALPIFGEKAIVVRDAHFVRQDIGDGVAAGMTFTATGFFKRQHNVVPGGRPRFEIDHMFASGDRGPRLLNIVFPPVPDNYEFVRNSVTFTIPDNFSEGDYLDFKISGGNSEWVQCDGIQIVEDSMPSVYLQEDATWDIARGNYPIINKQPSLWMGAVYLLDSHIIYPNKSLDRCQNGWVLVWSYYDIGVGPVNSDWQFTYVPKKSVSRTGGHRTALRAGSDNLEILKYYYVFNNRIKGNNVNGGVNRNLCLREILEF